MEPKAEYVGELPAGDWRFCLVKIESRNDVVLIVERNGRHVPRIIIDGKLQEIWPC